jgi:phosphatidylglycerophosphate synthase
MLDSTVRRIASPSLDAVAGALQGMGLRANAITGAGFVFGLIAIVAIALDGHLLGFLMLILHRLCDGVDGPLARRTTGPTPYGGFLDSALRPIIYAGVPFGFAVAHPGDALGAVFFLLGLVATIATQVAAGTHTIARPEKFGSFPFSPIIMEHTEIFICFALMCLMPSAFTPFAFFFGFLCFVSAGLYVAAARGDTAPR